MTYEQLKKKALYEIAKLKEKGFTKFAIYPYEDFGCCVQDVMNNDLGIEPQLIIDDEKANNDQIVSLAEAAKILTEDTIILLCSDAYYYFSNYYYEIRNAVYKMFSKDRIVDLTPQPVETLSKSFPRYLNIVDYDMIMDPLEKMRDKKVIIFGDSYRTEEILKILSLLKISPYKLVCNDDLGIRLFSSIVDCETMNSYLSPVNNNHEKEFVIIGDSDDWYTLLEKLDCPTFEKIEVTTTFAFYRSMLHHRTEVYQEINDYLDFESRNNIRQHDSQEIVDSKNILLKQLPKSQVIVYQPGKVGSMSVNYSLISAGCKSLHVHSSLTSWIF